MYNAMKEVRQHSEGTFPLQITSMIDMFTMILVFLLKIYASSSIDLTPSKNMQLPTSTSADQPVEALKLLVSESGIFVDDKEVTPIVNGMVPTSALDTKDNRFVRPLYDALSQQMKKSQAIASKNTTLKVDGKIIFQADQRLSYQTLRKIMYTSSLAGYTDFKFAVISLQ